MDTGVNDRSPNFTENGKFYLIRCFVCEPDRGRENWSMAVASGQCAFCGWQKHKEHENGKG